MKQTFCPEGALISTTENKAAMQNAASLAEAMNTRRILEAKVEICDSAHNLIVDLCGIKGIIPREEGAIGVSDGTTGDIALISRVNKPVCFYVNDIYTDESGETQALLSRREVQEDCRTDFIYALSAGDVIPARITHLEAFGAFVDIGCGIPSLVPIDAISVSRISHPSERFSVGQNIFVAVKGFDGSKVLLTHKELLGTWEQNADRFEYGQTVAGIIRAVEPYGIFIELTPNLAGLAEPQSGIKSGQLASVYIKSISPDLMKVKLVIVNAFDAEENEPPTPLKYFITSGHIDTWRYSTEKSPKKIETIF